MTAEPLLDLPQKNLVLVIDDDPVMRRLIRLSMEKEGYEVAEASNGKEGLDIFYQRIPDIILLDFMMPVMNGLEFCAHLQGKAQEQSQLRKKVKVELQQHSRPSQWRRKKYDEEETAAVEAIADQHSEQLLSSMTRTPILMITALEDDESVTQAFDAGATDFITKPIHWAILKQRVKHLIHQSQLYQRLEAANEQLQRLAAIDQLTQLANRRVFDLVLERQWRLMLRNQTPLSLIFADIDYFKGYNDFYGHQAGDHCLFEVAQAIASQVHRPTDLVARYGGEEITIILPDTSSTGAALIAHNIQEKVRSLKIPHEKSAAAPFVTISLGVASIDESSYAQSYTHLLKVADQALYEAKAKGRNCIVLKEITQAQ